MEIARIEFTDTFGDRLSGNYNWVQRLDIPSANKSDLSIIRAAKKLLGLSGIRSITHNYGDQITLEFPQNAFVVFINFGEV